MQMNRRLLLTILLSATTGATAQQPRVTAKSTSNGIEAQMDAKATYNIGDPIDVRVVLYNRRDKPIYLPGTLECSDNGRYPRTQLDIYNTSGTTVNDQWLEQFRNKNASMGDWCNSLQANDLVLLRPGEGLNIHKRIDEHGFWTGLLQREGRAPAPGDYTLEFSYDTRNTTLKEWTGNGWRHPNRPEDMPDLAEKRWQNVPKDIDVHVRTTIHVKESR
jgi:hypothetical protein